MALLEVANLCAGYTAADVLRGVTFAVEQGGITAILGANGAGKTTLLRAVSGMLRRRGSIRFDGRSIDNMATEDIARLGVAHVPDGRGTFLDLTTEENLRIGAYTRKDRGAVARFHLFPEVEGATPPASRHALRRRAADACRVPGLDAAPPVAVAR
jgi:branched-chain amino acid transport system ATP-binding protein